MPETRSFPDAARARLSNAASEAGLGALVETHAALLDRVLLASDFALEVLAAEPVLLASLPRWLVADDACAAAPPRADEPPEAFAPALRRFRRRESLRLVVRDVAGVDDVDRTLAHLSTLAEVCIEHALAAAEGPLRTRCGTPRGARGDAQSLTVIDRKSVV